MQSLIHSGLPFYIAAAVTFLFAGVVVARREGLPSQRVLLVSALLVAGFFVGSRVHYFFAHRHESLEDGAASLLFGPGRHMPGGIALAVLLGLIGARLLRLPVARLGDAVVPAFGLGVVLVRLGCFVNGCCFGARTDVPWAVRFARGTGAYTIHMMRGWLPDGAAFSLPVHPTQLYFAAVGALMIGVGFVWRRIQRRAGETWLAALAVWGLANPIVESFRDPDYLTGSPHLGSSAFVIGCAALLGLLVWRSGGAVWDRALAPVACDPAVRQGRA